MTVYEVMIKANECLIKGDSISDRQKQNIINMFLASISSNDVAQRFYQGVRYPNNTDSTGNGKMYPLFFIPPYNNGKKYKTIMTVTPKTHILSANMYELEIIRLLHLFEPNNTTVHNMVCKTLERLKTTCYGNNYCGQGECFDASIVVLRFLSAAIPNEINWMKKQIDNFHLHFAKKHRHWGVLWYYWLCLSELPAAIPEIIYYKNDLLKQINRSCVMNSEHDKYAHPLCICIVRNCLARLPEYEYIKECKPYISDKDNRLHFNMS